MSTHHEHEVYSKTVFGFWLYLMTDAILFTVLFATYAVLRNATAGGPTEQQVIDLPFALLQSLVLLTSTFSCASAMTPKAIANGKKLFFGFSVTFLLGLFFLILQCVEFHRLIDLGYTWDKSAFLSSYFTMLGTHSIHIALGLLFLLFLLGQAFLRGLTPSVLMRLTCLRLFWIFLNIVWVVTFSYIYLWSAL